MDKGPFNLGDSFLDDAEGECSLWTYIQSDLARISENTDLFSFLKWYLFPKGSTFPYQVWFRIMHSVKNNYVIKYTIGLVCYMIFRHYEYKYGIHANSNIHVGKGLKIVHGDGVYLNCKEIGENFTVYQNVTLGSGDNGIPTVGNNVSIYPGSVIAGGIVLHDYCIVGANSFVSKSVAPKILVAGCPAKKIKDI